MLEYLSRARWHEIYDFLVSGSPPIYVRLLALNALFLAFYAVRKAAAAKPLSMGTGILIQIFMLGANMLVLYQSDVESYLRQFIIR